MDDRSVLHAHRGHKIYESEKMFKTWTKSKKVIFTVTCLGSAPASGPDKHSIRNDLRFDPAGLKQSAPYLHI